MSERSTAPAADAPSTALDTYPNLESHVAVLWKVPHPDLTDRTWLLDVVTRRWPGQDAAIYVERRGKEILLRLDVKHAEELIDALTQAVLAAKVMEDIDLPQHPALAAMREQVDA